MFSSLVQLMSEVVLRVHPTVHAGYQANKDAIGVSTTALCNKLDRVETRVSAAQVRDSAELAEPVVKALRASHPRGVPGYQIKILDGIIYPRPSTASKHCAALGPHPCRVKLWWSWISLAC
jgi:hypothetical protein